MRLFFAAVLLCRTEGTRKNSAGPVSKSWTWGQRDQRSRQDNEKERNQESRMQAAVQIAIGDLV